MRKERRIEATFETETLLLIRGVNDSARGWCERCGTDATLVTPLAAARALGVSTRLIYARVEAGAIHFTERADGALLVCLASANATA